jgi:hypothetical protein
MCFVTKKLSVSLLLFVAPLHHMLACGMDPQGIMAEI